MTATVGGMWDAMLAEGLPWWITASSDAHKVYGQRWRYGGSPTEDGSYPDPVPDDTPARPAGCGRASTAVPTSALPATARRR
ncbi:hypothetical protein ACFQZ4_48635 [Catellatospora coxensis]